ncbi:hypothetical protein TA3x_005677 [Tundrisphaera sp. TA3]|uniref:hypothetical protein n=1 Tax=Tundrisphaera sp. TA3 TaxID=3435775 RepID=UPI003EBA5917
MIGKFAQAFCLLGANLPLFGLIILTLWLPANIAIEASLIEVPAERAEGVSFRLNQLIGGAFGPIVLGALIFAIAGRMRGERVGYFEAMAVGFRHWGRMFAARFFANFRILLGLIALIIPGIVLGVRYSLLEPAIIMERPSDAGRRSTDLTLGRRWPIFFALAIALAFDYACGLATRYAFQQTEALDNFWAYVAADCLLDVVESLSTVILVLFYLEARQQEAEDAEGREGHLQVDPGSWDLDGPAVAFPGEFAR